MVKYKKHQFFASIWVAIFIVSFSLCLTVLNRSVYGRTLEAADGDFYRIYQEFSDISKQSGEKLNQDIVIYDMEMDYRYLAEDFSSFFKFKYNSMDYKINPDNIEKLNDLKGYYRVAWVLVVMSSVGMIYSFSILKRGRYYSPFLYGGALGTLLTAFNCFRIYNSDKPVLSGVRDMVLYEDYSFFVDGDMITKLIPPEFAKNLAYTYLFFVFALVVVMVLIRLFLLYRSRPHKF